MLARIALTATAAVVAAAGVGLAARPAAAAPAGCASATPAAVAAYFDSAVPGRLAQDRVPGAVVSVVSGGRTVFTGGYGVADAEHHVPLRASRSLVRIASITKLFTWTAVMQQVQAGKLDLDADVNRYLTTFHVPATYPRPVTLRDLMDHTAGFEDRVVGIAARTARDVPPLAAYLAANMPARIRPPGVVSAYSNYGAALAGYIVSQVSGEPWDQYVRHHILDPLGMAHTTATEPVPAALAGDLARSYDTDTTPARRVPFQFDVQAPDGSVSATADDMARFMVAHLDGGPILAPATLDLMHQRSFAADPRLDGYAHGFKEQTINGHRVLMHDGGWEGFTSGLLLVPDCDLGLFVSVNGTVGSDTLSALVPGFFDRFAPPSAPPPSAPASAPPSSTSDSHTVPSAPRPGFYAPTRHNESTLERVLLLLGPARLTVTGNGTVHFGGKDWTPQANGVYLRSGGGITNRLAFRTGTDGQRYVITDTTSYQLLGRTDTLPYNLVVLLVFVVVALTALAVPVAGAWRRLRRRATAAPAGWRRARVLTSAAALLGLGFLVGLARVLFGDTGGYIYGAPFGLRLLLAVPVVALLAGVAGAACTVAGWRGSGAGVLARAHQVFLLAGLAVGVWFLWHWNLIGWWAI